MFMYIIYYNACVRLLFGIVEAKEKKHNGWMDGSRNIRGKKQRKREREDEEMRKKAKKKLIRA